MTQVFLNLVSNMGEQEIGTIYISVRLKDTVGIIICTFVSSLRSMVKFVETQAAKPREKYKPPAWIRGLFNCRPLLPP